MPALIQNTKTLPLVFLIDTSSSMDSIIAAVEQCLKDLVVEVAQWSSTKALDVKVSVIGFSCQASFLVGSEKGGIDVANVVIPKLTAAGSTAMNDALDKTALLFTASFDPKLKYAKPSVILLSDGHPNESLSLNTILATPLGKASTRLSIAFGGHADEAALTSFMSPNLALEVGVLTSQSSSELTKHIREATFIAMGNNGDKSTTQTASAAESMVV
jgi:uncharacterized protein YegL